MHTGAEKQMCRYGTPLKNEGKLPNQVQTIGVSTVLWPALISPKTL